MRIFLNCELEAEVWTVFILHSVWTAEIKKYFYLWMQK